MMLHIHRWGNYIPKTCMWQLSQREPEAVHIRRVARNRFWRPHSVILKLCQPSEVLFLWGIGLFCYLTLVQGAWGWGEWGVR